MPSSPTTRLCRNAKNPSSVMLSEAKHLAFSFSYEDEILRRSAQNDIKTQSRHPGGRQEGIERLERLERSGQRD
jgi:hypothetical protein